MAGKTDDFSRWLFPRAMLASAFNGVDDAREELLGTHRSREPKRRINEVEHTVPVLEQDRVIGAQLGGKATRQHTHSTGFTIRQLGSGNSDNKLIKRLTHVRLCRSSNRSTVRRDPVNPAFARKWAQLLANRRKPRSVVVG